MEDNKCLFKLAVTSTYDKKVYWDITELDELYM